MSDDQPRDHASMVPQKHGGRIHRGPVRRMQNPTVADVAERAAEWLFKIMPATKRIASNTPKRDKKSGTPKRPYKVADQLRAVAILAKLATLDRTLREVRVSAALANTRDEIIEFFDGDRDRAEALMAKIAPHWLGI